LWSNNLLFGLFDYQLAPVRTENVLRSKLGHTENKTYKYGKTELIVPSPYVKSKKK